MDPPRLFWGASMLLHGDVRRRSCQSTHNVTLRASMDSNESRYPLGGMPFCQACLVYIEQREVH